jgi:hypothetical protein
MRLPQSQNNNVKNMCIVVNPVCMHSEQGGVNPSWDRSVLTVLTFSLPLSHDCCPPLSFGKHGCLFKLSPEPIFVSTWNHCHTDL